MADNTTTSAPPKKSIADFFRAPAALRTGAPKSIDVLSAVDLCESIAQTKDNALDSGASDSPTPVQPPQTISKVNTEEVAVAPAVLAPIIQLQQEHPIAQAPQLPQPTTTATPSVHPFFNIKARKEQLEKERLEKEMAEKVSELQTQQQESTEAPQDIPAPPQQPQQKPKRKRASKKTTPQQPPDETAEEETVPTEVPETVNPPKQKRQRKKRVKAAEESKVVAIPDSTTVPVPVADELAAVQEQSQQAPTVPTESNLGERDTFLSQENNSSCSMPVEAFVEPVQNCPEPVQVAEPNLPLDVTTEEEIVLPTPPRVILKNPLQSTKVVHPFFNLAAQKEKILKKDVAVAESEGGAGNSSKSTDADKNLESNSLTSKLENAEENVEQSGRRKSRRAATKAPLTYYPALPPIEELDPSKGREAEGDDFKPIKSKSKRSLAAIPSVEKQSTPEPEMIYKPLTDEQLLTANAFFLSGPQRKLQKMLQDQAKLMKEIQESQAISAEFSKGKSANPFLQPRLFTATTSSCSTISELKGPNKYTWSTATEAPWPQYPHTPLILSQSHILSTSYISTPFKLKSRPREIVNGVVQLLTPPTPIRLTSSSTKQPMALLPRVESFLRPVVNLLPNMNLSVQHILETCTRFQRIKVPCEVIKSYLVRLHSADRLLQPPYCGVWEDIFEGAATGREDGIIGVICREQVLSVKNWLESWNSGKKEKKEEEKPSILKFKKPSYGLRRVKGDERDDDDAYVSEDDEIEDSEEDSVGSFGTASVQDIDEEDEDDVFQPLNRVKRRRKDSSRGEQRKRKQKDADRPLHLRLIGPPSSGRSSAVRTVAAECGYDVIEIHSGQKRTGKDVLALLGEATQSHGVVISNDVACEKTVDVTGEKKTALANFFAPRAVTKKDVPAKEKKEVTAGKRKRQFVVDDEDDGEEVVDILTTENESAMQPQAARPSLIVVEDADILFEQDKGFWAAMWSIMEVSKRPIVFICSEDPISCQNLQIPPNLLTNLSNASIRIYFSTPKPLELFCYLHLHLLRRGCWIDHNQLLELVKQNNCDVRRCLGQVEFQCALDRVDIKEEDVDTITVVEASCDEEERLFTFQVCEDLFVGGQDPEGIIDSVSVIEADELERLAWCADMTAGFDYLLTSVHNQVAKLDAMTSHVTCTDDVPGAYPLLLGEYSRHGPTLNEMNVLLESVSLRESCARKFREVLEEALEKEPEVENDMDEEDEDVSSKCAHRNLVTMRFPSLPRAFLSDAIKQTHQNSMPHEYWPYLTEMCRWDNQEQYEKNLKEQQENQEVSLGETDAEKAVGNTKKDRLLALSLNRQERSGKRTTRSGKNNPTFVRHFEMVLGEREALRVVELRGNGLTV